MGMTRYDKCTEVLKPYNGKRITTNKLRSLVLQYIGGTERTVFGILAFMREVGMIYDKGNCEWQVQLINAI